MSSRTPYWCLFLKSCMHHTSIMGASRIQHRTVKVIPMSRPQSEAPLRIRHLRTGPHAHSATCWVSEPPSQPGTALKLSILLHCRSRECTYRRQKRPNSSSSKGHSLFLILGHASGSTNPPTPPQSESPTSHASNKQSHSMIYLKKNKGIHHTRNQEI